MRKWSGESRGAHGEGLGSFKSRPRSGGRSHDTRRGGGCSSARRGRFRAAREERDGADRRGSGVSGWGRRRGDGCYQAIRLGWAGSGAGPRSAQGVGELGWRGLQGRARRAAGLAAGVEENVSGRRSWANGPK